MIHLNINVNIALITVLTSVFLVHYAMINTFTGNVSQINCTKKETVYFVLQTNTISGCSVAISLAINPEN